MTFSIGYYWISNTEGFLLLTGKESKHSLSRHVQVLITQQLCVRVCGHETTRSGVSHCRRTERCHSRTDPELLCHHTFRSRESRQIPGSFTPKLKAFSSRLQWYFRYVFYLNSYLKGTKQWNASDLLNCNGPDHKQAAFHLMLWKRKGPAAPRPHTMTAFGSSFQTLSCKSTFYLFSH